MNVFGGVLGLVAQHDQRRRFVRPLGHAPECAHLEFFDLVGSVGFAFQADFGSHFLCALGQHGRSHSVGRFVNQIAGEVLRLGNDASGLDCLFQRLWVTFRLIVPSDDSQRVNALVLAVALVDIGLEIAYEGALDDGLGSVGGRDAVFR